MYVKFIELVQVTFWSLVQVRIFTTHAFNTLTFKCLSTSTSQSSSVSFFYLFCCLNVSVSRYLCHCICSFVCECVCVVCMYTCVVCLCVRESDSKIFLYSSFTSLFVCFLHITYVKPCNKLEQENAYYSFHATVLNLMS